MHCADSGQASARLGPLIAYARGNGWTIILRPNGSLLLRKAGLPDIYKLSQPAARDAQSLLRCRHG